MNLWRRVCAVWLCVLLMVPLLARPAGATEVYPDNGVKFWKMVSGWVGLRAIKTFLDIGVTEETATEDDWRVAYERYTEDIKTNVGTATVIDGGIRLYFNAEKHMGVIDQWSFSGGTLFSLSSNYARLKNNTVSILLTSLTVPFAATYKFGYSIATSNCSVNPLYQPTGSIGKNDPLAFAYYGTIGLTALADGFMSAVGSAYVDLIPYTGVLGDFYNVDIGQNSRVGSITGDFGIIGDNNQIIKSDKNYIVNETTNNYYNPATGTEKPIVNWSYDYGDRSYTLQLEGELSAKVVFGDENITIKEGDTIYNIYYITNNPGGGGTDPSPSPHVHNYTPTVTKEPSCLASGVRTYTCSSCGSTYTETIPAAGHKWNPHKTVNTEYNEDGTVNQEGYTIWKCSVCGEEYKSSNTTGPPAGGGGTDGGGGGGIFKDIFGIFVDFIGFFSGLFKDFVAGGIKEFIKALTDPVSDIFGILNPFNWFD